MLKGHLKLFTPGPTPVPKRIIAAMSTDTLHHRTPEFKQIFDGAKKKLQNLINASNSPILLTGSGTLAMNAALNCLTHTNEQVLILNGGKFAERWLEIAKNLKLSVIEITCQWGDSFDLNKIEQVLEKNPAIQLVCFQHCETSTGVLHPINKIIELVNKIAPSALTVIDCITSIGVVEVNQKALNADVIIGSSQKALMLPPGLSFISLSTKAINNLIPGQFYWDLKSEFECQANGICKWTPATTLIQGLLESLKMIEEESYQEVYNRHKKIAEFTRSTFANLGFTIFNHKYPSPGLTALLPPSNLSTKKIKTLLYDNAGIRVAGGQGDYKDSMLRIGHMGAYQLSDLEHLASVIKTIL